MKKTGKKKINIIIEKTDTGFSAYVENLSVFTTGGNISELKDNMLEALNLYFEEDKIKVSPKDIGFQIDLKQFFQYYRVINARFLADRIGMNPTLLSQYVQGRKKPSEQQTEKIFEGIQQIGRELSELRLVVR